MGNAVGYCVGSLHYICHCADHIEHSAPGRLERSAKQVDCEFLIELHNLDSDQISKISKTDGQTEQIIDEIRHSTAALKQLPPDIQYKARLVYYDGLRYSFGASAGFALIAFCSALFANGSGLRSTK